MEITSFPHSESLHIPPVRTQNLLGNIRIGEIIVARVRQALADGSYLIAIKGRLVQADSAREFAEGEELDLVVRSLKPHMLLQIVSPKSELPSGEAVENVITSLGLSPSETTRQAVAALIKVAAPISAENVSVIVSLIDTLPTQADTEAAAYLLSVGLDPTPDLATSVAELMLGGDLLADLINSSDQSIVTLLQAVEAGESAVSDSSGPTGETLSTLLQNPHLLLLDPATRARLTEDISSLKDLAGLFRAHVPDLANVVPASDRLVNLLQDTQALATLLERELDTSVMHEVPLKLPADSSELLQVLGLPTTKTAIAQLEQLASDLGNDAIATQTAAVILATSAQKPSPSTVVEAGRLLSLLREAVQPMSELDSGLRESAFVFATLKEQLQGIQRALHALFINPASPEALREAVTSMAGEQMVNMLENIAQATQAVLQNSPYLRDLAIAIELLQSGQITPAKARKITAESAEEKIVALLPAPTEKQFATALRRLVARLKPDDWPQLLDRLLAREESRIRSMPVVEELSRLFRSIDDISRRMGSYKVLNMSSERQTPQVLYAEIPIRADEDSATARLKFYIRQREKGQSDSPAQPLTVALDLSTPSLGRVLGNLSLKDDLVRARLSVTDDVVRTMFVVHQRDLEERLKEVRFRLTFDIVCRRREVEPPPFLNIRVQQPPSELSRFDVRI